MNEPHWEELISAYVDDALAPRERQLVEERLTFDEAARHTLEAYLAQRQLFQKLPRRQVAPALQQRVLQVIHAQSSHAQSGGAHRPTPAIQAGWAHGARSGETGRSTRRWRQLNWRPATLCAVSLAALFLVGFLWMRGGVQGPPAVVLNERAAASGDELAEHAPPPIDHEADSAGNAAAEGRDTLLVETPRAARGAEESIPPSAGRDGDLSAIRSIDPWPSRTGPGDASNDHAVRELPNVAPGSLAGGGLGGGGLGSHQGFAVGDQGGLTPPTPGSVAPLESDLEAAPHLVVDQLWVVEIPDDAAAQEQLRTRLDQLDMTVDLPGLVAGEAEAYYLEVTPAFAERVMPEMGQWAVVLLVDATSRGHQEPNLEGGLPSIPRELEKRVLAQVHPSRSNPSFGGRDSLSQADPAAGQAMGTDRLNETPNAPPQQVISVGRVQVRSPSPWVPHGAMPPGELSALPFDEWVSAVRSEPDRLQVFAPHAISRSDQSETQRRGQSNAIDERLGVDPTTPKRDRSTEVAHVRCLILIGKDLRVGDVLREPQSSETVPPVPPAAVIDDK